MEEGEEGVGERGFPLVVDARKNLAIEFPVEVFRATTAKTSTRKMALSGEDESFVEVRKVYCWNCPACGNGG